MKEKPRIGNTGESEFHHRAKHLAKYYRKTARFLKVHRLMDHHTKETINVNYLFEHIGEMRMYYYIVETLDYDTNKPYNYNILEKDAIEKRFDIAHSTQNKYLSLLIQKGFIQKHQKGIYFLSDKFVGSSKKEDN